MSKLEVIKEVSERRDGDKEILKALKEHGDNNSAERPVLHYGYFENKKAYKEFKKFLQEQDVPFEPTKKGLGFVIVSQSTMIEEEIFESVDSVSNMFKLAGGEYDGWETQIVNDKTSDN